jgi:hypothetical protein
MDRRWRRKTQEGSDRQPLAARFAVCLQSARPATGAIPAVTSAADGAERAASVDAGPALLPSEPEQSPSPQPSGPTQLPDPLTGLLVAFAWWSARNSRDQRAIITLAREFHRAAPGGEFSYERVRLLNQDEVRRTCERLKDVQDITDKSVAAMKATRNGMSPTEYGTAVHATIAMTIGQSDPDFKAEISYEKMRQEGIKVPPPEAQQQGLNRPKQTHTESDYGIKGSIRVDVLERVKGTHTVCVYDIKTGRSGLSPRRMQEIALNVLGAFPDTNHIIVTEVRPTDPWRPR